MEAWGLLRTHRPQQKKGGPRTETHKLPVTFITRIKTYSNKQLHFHSPDCTQGHPARARLGSGRFPPRGPGPALLHRLIWLHHPNRVLDRSSLDVCGDRAGGGDGSGTALHGPDRLLRLGSRLLKSRRPRRDEGSRGAGTPGEGSRGAGAPRAESRGAAPPARTKP